MSYQNNLNTKSHFRNFVVLGKIILRNNVGLEYIPDETNLMKYVVLRKVLEIPDQVEKKR